jgi:DNA-binding transcriptional regulator PaaX
MNDSDPVDTFDERVRRAVDIAPYAIGLEEVARRVGAKEAAVLAALERLAAAGRMWMTADRATHAYYIHSEQLR